MAPAFLKLSSFSSFCWAPILLHVSAHRCVLFLVDRRANGSREGKRPVWGHMPCHTGTEPAFIYFLSQPSIPDTSTQFPVRPQVEPSLGSGPSPKKTSLRIGGRAVQLRPKDPTWLGSTLCWLWLGVRGHWKARGEPSVRLGPSHQGRQCPPGHLSRQSGAPAPFCRWHCVTSVPPLFIPQVSPLFTLRLRPIGTSLEKVKEHKCYVP